MLSVRQRGETVATLRWIHVRLMETIASWVPTTPEMEVKLLFGTHVWDAAQHADALGKRTFELRMPLQHSLEPDEAYRQLLANLTQVSETAERLALIYDGVLVALAVRYRYYLDQTDTLLDAPTARILENLDREQRRMIAEYNELIGKIPSLKLTHRGLVENYLTHEAEITNFVIHRADHTTSAVV
jgi:hypothetical protein